MKRNYESIWGFKKNFKRAYKDMEEFKKQKRNKVINIDGEAYDYSGTTQIDKNGRGDPERSS